MKWRHSKKRTQKLEVGIEINLLIIKFSIKLSWGD